MHNNIATKIKQARLIRDIPQAEAAKFIGVSTQQYHKYETGVNRISAVTLQMLAVLFNVEVSWFFQEAASHGKNDVSIQTRSGTTGSENGPLPELVGSNASCSAPNNRASKISLPASRQAGAGNYPENSAKHILLVDDEPDVRRLTGSFLRKAGFQVSEATGGDDVLARLASGERFDALITDYAMAGVSGLGLIEVMREIAPALPVLVVTGHSRDHDLIFGLPPKVQILAKPYSRNLFLAYVERLVGLPHKAGQLKDLVDEAPQF